MGIKIEPHRRRDAEFYQGLGTLNLELMAGGS